MARIEPPKSIADFRKVRKTIQDLMDNRWTDHTMFIGLLNKRKKVDDKIKELELSIKINNVK